MRHCAPPVALLLLVVLLVAAPRALATDVVILVNGTRLEGRIASESEGAIVLERTSAGGHTRITIPRDQVKAVERGPAEAPSAEEVRRPVRDEWWLLRSDQKTIGVRHLLLLRTGPAATDGWRFEETLTFLPSARLPGVRTQRIEETTADFLPRSLHWRERGDSGPGAVGEPYEVIRTGPVEDGVWKASVHDGPTSANLDVPLPRMTRGPLGLREALARAAPRPMGLTEMPLVDASKGEVRTVRAGFTVVDADGACGREAVLRVQDGGRTLESRWGIGDPPRCLSEELAPGVTAVPCTKEQADAATAPPRDVPTPSPLDPAPVAPEAPKHLTLPDVGFDLTIPGASWVSEIVPTRPDDAGPYPVAKLSSRLLAADVRIEAEPKAGGGAPADAEAALFARLQRVSKDLAVAVPRNAVAGVPGAFVLTLSGTVRGERLRTLAMVADRGTLRVTLLAACPESAWADSRAAIEALLASFRWL